VSHWRRNNLPTLTSKKKVWITMDVSQWRRNIEMTLSVEQRLREPLATQHPNNDRNSKRGKGNNNDTSPLDTTRPRCYQTTQHSNNNKNKD
jgi:hypothetical protein